MLGRAGRLVGLIATTVAVGATSATTVLFTRDDPSSNSVQTVHGKEVPTTSSEPTTTTKPPTTTTTAPTEETAAPEPRQNTQPSGGGSSNGGGSGGGGSTATTPATQAPQPPPPTTPAPSNLAGQVFDMINQSRGSAGLPALSWDGQLSGLASEWASYLGSLGTLLHRNLQSVITSPAFARWSTLGENLYVGPNTVSASDVHAALMASAPHKANILNGSFTLGAVAAFVSSDGRLYVVENFGAKF
jgi:uncharacterized protein YkwD